MKVVVASDLHGSLFYTNKLIERFNIEKADRLVLLGDLYYHGPRNPFPEQYDSMGVCKALNAISDKLLVVKGNCDSEVDEMISDFSMQPTVVLLFKNKTFTFTHGHIFNKQTPPTNFGDALIYGHFHEGMLEIENNKIYANPGSISLPKNNSLNSYLVIADDGMELKGLDGCVIRRIDF